MCYRSSRHNKTFCNRIFSSRGINAGFGNGAADPPLFAYRKLCVEVC